MQEKNHDPLANLSNHWKLHTMPQLLLFTLNLCTLNNYYSIKCLISGCITTWYTLYKGTS